MHRLLKAAAGAVLGLAVILSSPVPGLAQSASDDIPFPPRNARDLAPPPGLPSLNLVRSGNRFAHIFPNVELRDRITQTTIDNGPLIYGGGPIMGPTVNIYNIYWLPSSGKLQNGSATTLPVGYQTIMNVLTLWYSSHGIANNNTQYYQVANGVTTFVSAVGTRAATYVDTASYPTSGCTDTVTPGDCITDAQLQTELKRVMTVNGWTGGLGKLFVMFTSSGEGSCFDSTNASCAYTAYCAYHSGISGTTPIFYANIPYGDPTHCQSSGVPSPNNNAAADTAATSTAHEITESITDPEGNAWLSPYGNEIGDLCAYDYGINAWDGGLANQMWGGHYFELQMMWDNHTGTCVQVGP
jgi:hypothetical protein